jgi:hypothetical protein
MRTSTGEVAAARWLDAEDPVTRQVLAWAMEHDPVVAGRLADALGWWWWQRGRLVGHYPLLRELAGRTEPGSDEWCAAQCWLARAAFFAADMPGALSHCAALCDAVEDRGPSRMLADALADRSIILLTMGRLAEGAEDGRRSLGMARELRYPFGEGYALDMLAIAASYSGDYNGAVQLIRQQQLVPGIPGSIVRGGARYWSVR